MVFQVPRSRNITFRTSSGRGGIFLNGRDVADVLDKTLGETVESVATLRTEVTELKEKCQTLQTQNPRVDCFNTVGSRFCGPCPPGYVGDGVTCSYVGACNVNNGGCSPLARCIVRSGGFHECLCPPGYVGGGVGASGCVPQGEPGGVVVPSPVQPPLLDPCAARPCSHGFCQPRGNDFVCICETGYSGRLCDRTRDACASEPCHNNGTCMSGQGGSFACSCTPEWTGATCDEPRQSCEDTLYGLNGTLRYPETGGQYAHKRDCTWIIHTSQEKVLNLTFPVFHLEEGHECAFDYLEVHDGPTSNRRTIGRYCGTTLSGTSIVSGQPAVYLHFHSDSSVAGDGFTMEWTSVEPRTFLPSPAFARCI
ncbi:hypothetical protein HPB48_004320 [Haemaphysalis longicornis]|uniref:Cubilin n=1 Tax=Haemaphysalis longicornis TaxID=44386 RepID=A0A9J6G0R0_HAELO|nr:hypothetical protein HPB48_004320 [Haemaphysalis longicornis]